MPDIMTMLPWFLTALSLTGNLFIIKKNVTGQWVWAIANTGWIPFHYFHNHDSASAFLFTVYLGLTVWGIISWTKSAKAAKQAA
ncbi:MAG: hypothetical protein HN411_03340 [Waddliaceae bacterium]|nr:hypothetical protein [Waddliaceae bacterium]MBT3578948.1 hypothetical protein [Waddliaceae bacterium]MBT4445493.1 hypothetical protein [Waddliaceae bacterium]MBT6928984.1 hypothetical protein [Waddliaceae bacterium]MBT7263982.1 hypothetical protein [Waddliaceae bacterium]